MIHLGDGRRPVLGVFQNCTNVCPYENITIDDSTLKMFLVHRTIHEHNIQRQDFERLCSNHTIKQYDVEYENTRKRLNGQPGTNELQFMNKKIKLEFGDTLKLNKTAGMIFTKSPTQSNSSHYP